MSANVLSPNPEQMINLCVISYEDEDKIQKSVNDFNNDLKVVWGPAWLESDLFIKYSLAYITQSQSTGHFNVVIRGTNPISLKSWLGEDFSVKHLEPFSDFAKDAHSNAKISKGTYNGLNDLLKLRPKSGYPGHNHSLLEFLQNQSNLSSFFVTGHSLGGTLTPALYAYLYYELVTKQKLNISTNLMSFAGLTSGNQEFANYLNGTLPKSAVWRYHNPLDIAPFMFWSESNIENIYKYYGLSWSDLEKIPINDLFKDASGKGYVQPSGGDYELPAVFYINEQNSWAGQAIHQHHSTTYRQLITQNNQAAGQ